MSVLYQDVCYDTEFIEDGRTIGLVSIGMLGPDGEAYYAVSSEFDMSALLANKWLVENVLPYLPTRRYTLFNRWAWVAIDKKDPIVKPRAQIRDEVLAFISRYEHPRLWAYYGAYDHVALAQLWGPMITMPDKIPKWTADVRQECVRLGNPRLPPQTEGQHHALADATHTWEMLQHLRALEREKARV